MARKYGLTLRMLAALTLFLMVLCGIAVAQKTVHVRTYTRKDGTVVKAHDRRAPGSRGGVSSSAPSSANTTEAEEANTPIGNSDIIYLVADGVATEEIKAIIAHARSGFDTCRSALQELKSKGVSDELIAAMVASSLTENNPLSSAPPSSVGSPTAASAKHQSPELQGFHLGMTVREADGAAPLLTPADNTGVQKAYLSRPSSGILTAELEFLDGLLVSIQVNYDGSVKWSDEKEFLTAVASRLGLSNAWTESNNSSRIVGQGFYLDANYSFGIMPRLHLYDPLAQQTIVKRKADQEEMKRRAFKP
jgi:hypothetical protein